MNRKIQDKFSSSIVETTREPMLGLNADLRVNFANHAFYKTFQVTPKQTIGKLVYDLGNKQWDIPQLRKLLEEILPKKNTLVGYEIDHKFLDIGHKVMLLNARKLIREPGEEPMILLAIEDITQRKLLEDSLADYTSGLEEKVIETIKVGKARETAILQSIGEGLIVLVDVDKGGKIAYVNKAFEELVGWKKRDVVDKFIVEVIPREDKEGKVVPFKERIVTKVLAGEKVVADINQPFYYVRRDKTKFPVASVITPIWLNKKVIGAVEIFRDITKESAADKAKTEFASLVSHQLRTPFSTINWYVELLLAGDVGKLNAKQTQYLEEVYRASKRMVGLVNVLLSISRIEMGTDTIDKEPVNFTALADVILEERRLEMHKKKLTLQKAYDKKIPKIEADPKQITMVFENLISNAIKYTPPGGKVSLSIEVKKANLLVGVADSGIGIPKADQAKIFTRFFRANSAKQIDAEGAGLGLYILKAIVDQMQGKVWFKSQEHKGTTFYISFPLTKKVKK